MPSDKEFYEGSYSINITAKHRFQGQRLWCHKRTGRLDYQQNDTETIVLKDRHRPASSPSERTEYAVKAFATEETNRVLATCGAKNDWIMWHLPQGTVIAKFTLGDIYAPRDRARITLYGAFAELQFIHPDAPEPYARKECFINE